MITLILRKQTFQLAGPLTVLEALAALGLSPETHLAVRDGVLLEENDQLQDGDVVRLVAAISGG